ncbi:uncharacterized protein A1O5_07828 [Cladophialophora psammophila CBS 110553]|uniref:Peptidase A1 domain-containing protein n=1 Tax=Cladophialophora psammophila CBS 110553 TaxID=1182543 RepID=W9WW88_9EURO|nr:uncharacterized protein A1O5_07828 [Cladophialophora psammophila CBS 110553]EXJ68896.1 hypothetical protein A1O5_07828 [Cladophialophora psammophila CBS 110553]
MWESSFLPWAILFALLCMFPVTALSSSSVYGLLYDWGLLGAYPQQTYKSCARTAPRLNFVRWDDAQCGRDAGSATCLSPRGHMVSSPGPLIMDSRGELVWAEDKYGQAMDFKVQCYRGQNYLTFWTESDSGTFGRGSYVMLDSSYRVYKRVTPANGLDGDLHEFQITRRGTALMTVYEPTPANLSAFGIGAQGWIYDSVFQEVDIETGELIFEWRASQHYDGLSKNAKYGRGMVISLELEQMTAKLIQEYVHPDQRLVGSQGSIQLVPDLDHALVGWGHVPAYTEFDAQGNVLCDVRIAPSIVWSLGWVKSYRAFRASSWVGKPSAPPDVYLRPNDRRVHVDAWVLQGHAETGRGVNSSQEDSYRNLSHIKKEKFETSFIITDDMPRYLRVAALDRVAHTLGYTAVVDRRIGNAPLPDARSRIVVISICAVTALCLSWYLWRIRTRIPRGE